MIKFPLGKLKRAKFSLAKAYGIGMVQFLSLVKPMFNSSPDKVGACNFDITPGRVSFESANDCKG